MYAKNKKLAVCVVEAQGVMLYMEKYPTGNSYAFPQGTFTQMEITNYEVFHSFIATIAAATQLGEHDVIVVFGNSLLFEKQLPPLPAEKVDVELTAFKEATPFERVGTRTYKNAQGTYLVSINRDFFDTLRQSIERNGSHILAILPISLFLGIIGKQGMNLQALRVLSSRLTEIIELSLISGKVTPKTFQEREEYLSKQYSGLLIVVFVLFIIGVIGGTGFILRSQFQATRSPNPTSAPVVAPVEVTATPTVSPTPQVESTRETLRIMVQYSESNASQSAQLQKTLKTAGFSQLSEKKVSNITSEKSLILFRPFVSSELREQIGEILEKAGVQGALQENAEIETDVWVTLGK